MDPLTLTFRKWDVRYLPAGELIQVDEPITDFDANEDRLLADHPRMRRLLARLLPRSPLTCYYVHWSDSTDLELLDESVAAGYATGEYFAGAVVGQTSGMTCLKCRARSRVVSLDIVVTSLFFEPDHLARTRRHTYRTSCVMCRQPWSTSVLEFIDKR